MCGFAGLINFDKNKHVERHLVERMITTIHHRGPDEDGLFIENNVGLGFKRLSIIDLEHGQQPMTDINKRVWIVFNGEIYNHENIKKDLVQKGYRFRTSSDTEVILNCYLEYGQNCVDKLTGMFAFVIWDKTNNSVFIARDRFGIKPFYYLVYKDGIAFASELKALYESNLSGRDINIRAVDSFFTYGYILSPHTIYNDIKKLPAAHTLMISLNPDGGASFDQKKYWHPTFKKDTSIGFEEYKELIRTQLKESVKRHLVSDVPVGAFLSGGIDSNSVVALMAELYGGKIKTFTVGFNENKFNESHLAKITSQKYDTEHHEIIIHKNSALNLEKIINMYDEPFGDSSAIPTYFVSRLASQFVKVVLSGDGGDEFFGGYANYQRLQKINKFKLPRFVRYPVFRSLSKLLPEKLPGKRISYTLSQDYDHIFAYFNHMWLDEKRKIFSDDIFKQMNDNPVQKIKIDYLDNSLSDDYLSKMMELDILTYITDDILTKVDRASMANSLEVRVPIIDHEFFDVAMKIPPEYKVTRNKGKYIFREAMKSLLPPEIYNKEKSGFTIPIYQWFKDDLNDFVHDNIRTGDVLHDFIKDSYLLKLKDTKNLGSMITRIWPMIVFNHWLKNIHR